MTPDDLYLFDTCGFLHVGNCLTPSEVREFRSRLKQIPTVPCHFRNTLRRERLVESDDAFRRLSCDARLRGRAMQVINQPLRLVESYSLSRRGASVLFLHNGLSEEIEYEGVVARRNMGINHTYHDGHLYCMYVKAICYLTDIATAADGPFCYVEGSHKAHFPLLSRGRPGGPYEPLVDRGFPSLRTVYVKAGDMILLNEALLHGTLRKTTDCDRVLAAFSYTPSFVADYTELQREGDPDAVGHFEFAEEALAVAAGHQP